jgi:hypothetical protein
MDHHGASIITRSLSHRRKKTMSKFKPSIRLLNEDMRNAAAAQCKSAPYGVEVLFRERKRTHEQNDRMWAMLADVAKQLEWHGQKLTKEQWKLIFLSGLHRDAGIVPDYSGTGVIPLNISSSSSLTVSAMTDMITLIEVYGNQKGVRWKNETQ